MVGLLLCSRTFQIPSQAIQNQSHCHLTEHLLDHTAINAVAKIKNTYQGAGVDLDIGDGAVFFPTPALSLTFRTTVLSSLHTTATGNASLNC